jgi:hypothetical protein
MVLGAVQAPVGRCKTAAGTVCCTQSPPTRHGDRDRDRGVAPRSKAFSVAPVPNPTRSAGVLTHTHLGAPRPGTSLLWDTISCRKVDPLTHSLTHSRNVVLAAEEPDEDDAEESNTENMALYSVLQRSLSLFQPVSREASTSAPATAPISAPSSTKRLELELEDLESWSWREEDRAKPVRLTHQTQKNTGTVRAPLNHDPEGRWRICVGTLTLLYYH